MKVWITKYALTEGILEGEAKDNADSDMVSLLRTGHWLNVPFPTFHGSDWHRTEAEAVAHANKMVAKKIASLKKSLAKFEKMKFEVKG